MSKLEPSWNPPPAALALTGDEVHVWRASLDQPGSRLQRCALLLSTDERQRAERFLSESHRAHFIAGRGILRTILARYSGLAPGELRFTYGPRGKPALAEAAGGGGLRFTVSHSGGLALYAVAIAREVGVDLERVRPLTDVERIAERFLSDAEKAAFHALPAGEREEGFLKFWTRKEAYVKARGEGLALALTQFDVLPDPDEATFYRVVTPDPQAFSWSVHELAPGPGYVAALALEGSRCALRCWAWAIEND